MALRSIPDEVVIEILSWLPDKDLIRSRCVCRSWLRLLTTDLHFHKLHLHRFTTNPPNPNPSILLMRLHKNYYSLLTHNQEAAAAAASKIQCPFNISSPRQSPIFGICHGLLCIANSSQEESHDVYVWNPLTNEHVTISCPPIPSHFPTRMPSITYGFGFCQVTRQFKVIRILSLYPSEFHSDVSVYTLGTSSWRTLGSIPYNIEINILEHSTALVNNALHWFAARPGSSVRNVLVSFNMEDENFQEVPHPNGIRYNYPYHATVGELAGLLGIFFAVIGEQIEIWVMKEYGVVDSWTKQYRIGRPEVSGTFNFMKPVGLADGGDIIIMKNDRNFILYNPGTNSTRTFKKFRVGFNDAYPYTGSLISPRVVNGVDA